MWLTLKEPHLVYRIRVVHEKPVVELKTVCICIFHLWELQQTTYRYSSKTCDSGIQHKGCEEIKSF